MNENPCSVSWIFVSVEFVRLHSLQTRRELIVLSEKRWSYLFNRSECEWGKSEPTRRESGLKWERQFDKKHDDSEPYKQNSDWML